MRNDCDDFDDIRDFTYDELIAEIEREYKNMSEQEKYIRLRDVDPAFTEFCASYVKPGQTISINYTQHTHEIIPNKTQTKGGK